MSVLHLIKHAIKLVCIFALFAVPALGSASALAEEPALNAPAAGFQLSGRYIHDANGTSVIMR